MCLRAYVHQGLHCVLTESLDTTECMNGEQRCRWYFAHAQDDLNLHILPCLKSILLLNQSSWYTSLSNQEIDSTCLYTLMLCAGLGGSVGFAVWLETRRSRVQPPPRSATFFRGEWSWNIFYGHSLPSADSRRAVVSFWRKNVHNTG